MRSTRSREYVLAESHTYDLKHRCLSQSIAIEHPLDGAIV